MGKKSAAGTAGAMFSKSKARDTVLPREGHGIRAVVFLPKMHLTKRGTGHPG